MLHVQALQQQEEEEEIDEATKEKGHQSTRPLHIVAAPAPHLPIRITPFAKQRPIKVKVPKELVEQKSLLTYWKLEVGRLDKQVQTVLLILSRRSKSP